MSSNQKSNVARIVSENAGTEEAQAEVATVAEAPMAEAREVPSAPAQSAPASVAAPAAAKKRRSPVLPIVVLALLAGGGWYGYEWWTNGRFMVSTDDAYIEGDIATISPKVTGYVAKVNVVANQEVKAGDVLATLDNGDYQNALDLAQAQIVTEQLSLQRIDAQIEGANASLVQAQAQKVALEAAVRGAEITRSARATFRRNRSGPPPISTTPISPSTRPRPILPAATPTSPLHRPTSPSSRPSARKQKARSVRLRSPATRPSVTFLSPCSRRLMTALSATAPSRKATSSLPANA